MRSAVLCLIALAPLCAQEQPQTPSVDVTVQSVTGDVDLQVAGQGAPARLEKDAKVPIGATVVTGSAAQAVLGFGTMGVAIIGETTFFRVDECRYSGNRLVVRVYINPGLATASVKRLAQYQADFQVSTPRLTCSVRGSGVQVIANGDEVPDRALCVQDEATIRRLRRWLHRLADGERMDSDRTSHLDLSGREHQGFVSPFYEPNSEPGALTRGRLNADQIAQLAESTDVLTSDLTRDGSNPNSLTAPLGCSSVQIASDEQLLISNNLQFVVQYLRTGDELLRDAAQADVDSFHSNLTGNPTLVPVDEALHRLEHCRRFGDRLDDPTRP